MTFVYTIAPLPSPPSPPVPFYSLSLSRARAFFLPRSLSLLRSCSLFPFFFEKIKKEFKKNYIYMNLELEIALFARVVHISSACARVVYEKERKEMITKLSRERTEGTS